MFAFIKITYKGVVYSTQYKGKIIGAYVCFPQPLTMYCHERMPVKSPTHRERLRVVGCKLKQQLVMLLSQGTGYNSEPNLHMMRCMTHRLAVGLIVAVRNEAAKEANKLCTSVQFSDALVPMNRAIYLKDLPLRAFKAWMLFNGRIGVPIDWYKGFELVKEGTLLGCHHCQGLLAMCYTMGYECVKANAAQSLMLAIESSNNGSMYGQYVLGELYEDGKGVAQDDALAFKWYSIAVAQNFDGAQFRLGLMYALGRGVDEDRGKAFQLYKLAADQGEPLAMYYVAQCYEDGRGVPINVAKAIKWCRRAQAAGLFLAQEMMWRFSKKKRK
jgi:TPR repeat protein